MGKSWGGALFRGRGLLGKPQSEEVLSEFDGKFVCLAVCVCVCVSLSRVSHSNNFNSAQPFPCLLIVPRANGSFYAYCVMNFSMVDINLFFVQTLGRIRLCSAMDCSTPGFPALHHLPALLRLISIESVMLSYDFLPCRPLLLPSVFFSIKIFSKESALDIRWPKYWSVSFSISPSSE